MRTDQSCNLKEPNSVFPGKYFLQLLITHYDLLVLGVLKIVLLDVGPNQLERLGAGNLGEKTIKYLCFLTCSITGSFNGQCISLQFQI